MAAAVYLHNALFGQPPSSRSLTSDIVRPVHEDEEDEENDDENGENDDDEEADVTTPHSPIDVEYNQHRISASSQSTLVTPPPITVQPQPRYYARRSTTVYHPQSSTSPPEEEEGDSDLQHVDLSTDTDTTAAVPIPPRTRTRTMPFTAISAPMHVYTSTHPYPDDNSDRDLNHQEPPSLILQERRRQTMTTTTTRPFSSSSSSPPPPPPPGPPGPPGLLSERRRRQGQGLGTTHTHIHTTRGIKSKKEESEGTDDGEERGGGRGGDGVLPSTTTTTTTKSGSLFSRGRPKGRRRDPTTTTTTTTTTTIRSGVVPTTSFKQQTLGQPPQHPSQGHTQPHPPDQSQTQPQPPGEGEGQPPPPTQRQPRQPTQRQQQHRKGRIPNLSLTRTTRLIILTFRFLTGLVLCGWAAYSCARYWLAYDEFRPVAVSNTTTTALGTIVTITVTQVEDPPRSTYAFVLAITCTITTALLVLDSSYFLYFVLYPHDGRLLNRIPTITPIGRDNDESAAPDDAADDTDPTSPPPRPRPRPRPQGPVQDDKFTSMPHRSSAFSTSSGYRRSRRLSKPRPDSFSATYPPVGREVDRPEEREQAVDTNQQGDPDTRPSRSQERQSAVPTQAVVPPPPSRYVDTAPSTAPEDESDPQVEKQSKRTYMLHLPSLCHEPSISPLPFPPPRMTPIERNHSDPPRRPSRKWTRTRKFLHIIHWLAFIALNIPGFVNVGLVPVWYNPTQTTDVTGVNSPHRLSGLCQYSPDVIWAGTSLPPSRPPPCAQTIPYSVWLWGAIGRVLVTFALSGAWIVMDGVWWGAWVVGTRNIGWKGAIGRPWRSRRAPKQELEPEGDSEGLHGGELKENPWAKRIRLLSGASKASGRSGRSARSNKEKVGEFGARTPPAERGSVVSPIAAASVALASAPLGVPGIDSQDAVPSPTSRHKVRRKPVKPITPPSPSSNSSPTYSPRSPPLTTYGPGGKSLYFEQSRMPRGGIGSRRPSGHDSIGGSTVVGSPPSATYLLGLPLAAPASPPSSSNRIPGSAEEQTGSGNGGRRSMTLEIVPEQEPRSSDERATPEQPSPEIERVYPDRPQSRMGRYDDAAIFGSQYRDRPGARSPPSPTQPGWTADPNAFSPITSPHSGVPLLDRGYFMVGDGGFSAGNTNDGAYDEDSYYSAMATAEEQATPLSNQAGPSGANRATTPSSERSNSPNSYGHGHYAGVDVRVETPTSGGDHEYSPEVPPRLVPATQAQWYPPSTSQQPIAYQHPLAQGIQMALGYPQEFEREVRMLGSVVRRMSTIESFGSHERELSRRGSAATARTTQTGRGNSAGTAQREGTNSSGNSAPVGAIAMTNSHDSGDGNGANDSGGPSERNPETEANVGFVRATSPTDMSPI